MRLSDGPAAIVAALVGAGLAVGLAYGGNALLGEPDSDTSPAPNPTSPTGPSGDDLCALMEDYVVSNQELEEASFGILFIGVADMTEEERLGAIHRFGQTLVDGTKAIGGYLRRGAELIEDPDTATAFVQLAEVMEAVGLTVGTPALEAQSLEGYELATQALYLDPEFLEEMSQGEAAEAIVTAYVLDTCGIDLSGEGSTTVESPAQTDVTNLSDEIASYYFDWNEGDPHPVITVTDGGYYLNGVFLGEQSPGVTLTDQYAEGPEDWCVGVSSDDDPPETYFYRRNGFAYSAGWGVCPLVDVEVSF